MVLVCSTIVSFAQQMEDAVYLKNGSIIKGIVIEEIPNESLKIQTRDGSIFVYKMNEVEKITKQVVTKKYGRGSYNLYGDNSDYDLKTGFKFFTEIGYTFGNNEGGRAELLTAAGCQINPYLFVGGGVGLNYYTASDGDAYVVPIFADLRGYIPTGSAVHPYIDLKPGYGVNTSGGDTDGGFYINTTVGIEIKHFTIGIGYASQSFSIDSYYGSGSISSGGFTARVGLTF